MRIGHAATVALLGLCTLCSCSEEAGPAGPGDPGGAAPASGQGPQSPPVGNPVDHYIAKAGSYLASIQSEDGSWPYFHSLTPEFAEPEAHANTFGTMITLMNLTHTGFEGSTMFRRGGDFLLERMHEDFVWSFYEPGELDEDSWFEPDTDDTSVALSVLAERVAISPDELRGLRERFDRLLTKEGLYRVYFDGFHGEKGFVPDPNVPSIGVNLNILGFFGAHDLERASLLNSLREAMGEDRYWENSTFYLSLPVLAHFASNAVEHGAAQAGDLLRRLLADFAAGEGADPDFAAKMSTVELAAYVKARSHDCLLDQKPCRDLDLIVLELAKRRQFDGSWQVAPLYEYDVNPEALVSFLERKDFAIPRDRGGFAYDVERALSSPGTVHRYDGSPAETTSFALKALVFYRELLSRRSGF